MPEFCAAYSCSNRRTVESKARGITFHKFPRKDMRKKWERALRRKDFTATNTTVLCSEHFKPEDFDRTGQIVRLRDGVIPSIFSFPVKPQKVSLYGLHPTLHHSRSRNYCLQHGIPAFFNSVLVFSDSGSYFSPRIINNMLITVISESLEQEKKNAMAREKRARIALQRLLADLREKKLISDEFKERLEYYEGKTKLAI
uniref:THAP-type domain-containing protein n=1 Tax=Nothobranchius furzeri TaxID=105023 RepID=A0A8C6P0D4_NOTFU